ncbi:MAG: galactose mutarotase [Firmicutes bacterium]|nr:galactose mutarotase [Bacillota bacterium]
MATRCIQTPIGTYDDGRTVYSYRLEDEKGQYVSLMNIGCSILDLAVLDKNGELQDVVLGMPSFEHYHKARSVMGATVGRCANRIAAGTFTLNGQEYHLEKNERGGLNHLHGGKGGFQMRYWDAEVEGDTLRFRYESPDGEEGYPGKVNVTETVTFRDGRLDLRIDSVSDRDTIVNYTNHAFFNMNGQGSGSALNHRLTIHADRYSATGPDLIPTEALPVEGTPFDFRTPHTIGERIDADFKQVRDCGGYDVNFVLSGGAPAAAVVGDISGIRMEVHTDCPDMQFFSGMGLGSPFLCHGKNGATYVNFGGFCLEPHALPNAINTPYADQVILRAGETKTWHMCLAFSVETEE